MKRFILVFLAALLSCAALTRAEEVPAHVVRYYYTNYCEACDPEADFAESFASLTGVSLDACDYVGYNVVTSAGASALKEAGLEDASLPAAVVDGVAYEGATRMNTELVDAALDWGGSTDSIIVELYIPACESCARARDVLYHLDGTVSVKRGERTIQSAVRVKTYDVSQQPGLAQALFEAYDVPDDDRITPIVFFGDSYLAGADAIEKHLKNQIALGNAIGGVRTIPMDAEDYGLSPAGLLASIGAGLVAGLNTCALSMVLLVLALLLEAGHDEGKLAGCFLAGKFACYLLIGFALLGLFQTVDPAFLKPVARIALTILGVILIALNLWDAFQAHRGNLGDVKNQLPTRLRGKLHDVIRRFAQGKLRFWGMIALGVIVAAGEFLCAGQLFLMQLLTNVRRGGAAQAFSLIAYCIAFILPGAALCAVVLGGKSRLRAGRFLSDHMDLFKLLTAAVMALLVISAWIIR